MATVLNTVFKLKRGTSSRWAEVNPILQQGEPGFIIDENRLKIGDGVTAWNDLPYLDNEQLLADNETIIIENNTIKLKGFIEAQVGAQLCKNANGELDWVVPSTEAIDGVVSIVTTLQTEMLDIQNDVDLLKNIILSSEDDDNSLINRVQSLENQANKAQVSYEEKRYEIANLPEGAVVDYSDKEIRVFCPKDANWIKQNVGAAGNSNMYYMSFKAYAPKDAASFKEGDQGVIVNKMHTFDEDFSGVDEYGRKYSICWLALAFYDEDTDEWTYFGKKSTFKKYIGWSYVVEWYNEEGIMIGSDAIRINLSNEECHNIVEPYYMASINVDRLSQDEGTTLILYGGSATDNL